MPARSETVTQCASAILAKYPVRLSTSAVPTFIGSSEYSRLRVGTGGATPSQHSDTSTGRIRKHRLSDWISLGVPLAWRSAPLSWDSRRRPSLGNFYARQSER